MRQLALVGAAFRFELTVLRRSPGDLMALANTPLLTIILLGITRHAGRRDLDGFAVLAPAVMALWSMAILVSGEIVAKDRATGTLELLLASPASLPVVVLGRITAVTLLSLVSVAEAWLVARLLFGVSVAVEHGVLFAAALLSTALATAGWATALSGTFVVTRSARTFQNALSYPFYLLGGALVPVDLLPGWLRPITRLVYLSWATDLLRAAVRPGPVENAPLRLLVVLALGGAGFVLGTELLRRAVRRVTRTGTVTFG